MKSKVKLTRPELRRQRDALIRFQRYLPLLKLKQQQLQMRLGLLGQTLKEAEAKVLDAQARLAEYAIVQRGLAGIDMDALTRPVAVETHEGNVAGVIVPVLDRVTFPEARYSLLSTPPWVDRVLDDRRAIAVAEAERAVLEQQHHAISMALRRVSQRVNLFEKRKIPEAEQAIHRIQIRLGDEMTAAVGRAKIAKGKIEAAQEPPGPATSDRGAGE